MTTDRKTNKYKTQATGRESRGQLTTNMRSRETGRDMSRDMSRDRGKGMDRGKYNSFKLKPVKSIMGRAV